MLIIACGNRARGDDAAGLLVAERLQKLGVRVSTHAGDALALIDLWSGAEKVILIDAVTTGARAGTVHYWDADHLPPSDNSSSSTHGLDLAQAIALARNLHLLPSQLRVYGIEGSRFRLGEDISPAVERAVDKVAYQVAAEWSR